MNIEWHALLEHVPVCREDRCGYYGDRWARMREFSLERGQAVAPEQLRAILDHGYRRCGTVFYRPCCAHCRACLPYRVPLATFAPSRNLRRVRQRNRDLEVRIGPPDPRPEKSEIYLRYQRQQHRHKTPEARRKDWDEDRLLLSMGFQMYTNPAPTCELELRLPDGTLAAYGTLDVAAGTVSAVYFVFDPEFGNRSLGTFGILAGMDWARQQGADYYHLGYFLPGHPEMDYKKRFHPAEIRDPRDGLWKPCTETLVAAITNA